MTDVAFYVQSCAYFHNGTVNAHLTTTTPELMAFYIILNVIIHAKLTRNFITASTIGLNINVYLVFVNENVVII